MAFHRAILSICGNDIEKDGNEVLTHSNSEFIFQRPDGISEEDFLKMKSCMTAIAVTMANMVKSDSVGSCGVRICRSRRDRTFGTIRRIFEVDTDE